MKLPHEALCILPQIYPKYFDETDRAEQYLTSLSLLGRWRQWREKRYIKGQIDAHARAQTQAKKRENMILDK